jgi:DNA-directed RNA polymerase specialized sigma subunit
VLGRKLTIPDSTANQLYSERCQAGIVDTYRWIHLFNCSIDVSFSFFMENQIMGEFARILRISKLSRVSLQLLQTMSIMIQNLKNEHSICK